MPAFGLMPRGVQVTGVVVLLAVPSTAVSTWPTCDVPVILGCVRNTGAGVGVGPVIWRTMILTAGPQTTPEGLSVEYARISMP